jgi:hypothetical protein
MVIFSTLIHFTPPIKKQEEVSQATIACSATHDAKALPAILILDAKKLA